MRWNTDKGVVWFVWTCSHQLGTNHAFKLDGTNSGCVSFHCFFELGPVDVIDRDIICNRFHRGVHDEMLEMKMFV